MYDIKHRRFLGNGQVNNEESTGILLLGFRKWEDKCSNVDGA